MTTKNQNPTKNNHENQRRVPASVDSTQPSDRDFEKRQSALEREDEELWSAERNQLDREDEDYDYRGNQGGRERHPYYQDEEDDGIPTDRGHSSS